MNALLTLVFTLAVLEPIASDSFSSFLINTRSTRLVNRTVLGSPTECSVRLGRKEFTSKFYRMITCRYVHDLASIYPYLLTYSNEITALEITDSTIDYWNSTAYSHVFRRLEFLVFHRTTLRNITACPLNVFTKKLFYLHLTDFSPSLEQLVSHRSCLRMKRLHVLIVDRTSIGDGNILRQTFPNLHILRLNFTALNQPLNASLMRSFPYLQDFFFKVNDDCHRCEYEWLKYAARDDKALLFRISPQSGCMDWHDQQRFLAWSDAPLCGSCSLPLLSNGKPTNEMCQMEDGITEYYCKAYYGRQSLFQPWTTQFDPKAPPYIPLASTRRPNQEFMKHKFTAPILNRLKRDLNETTRPTTVSSETSTSSLWLSRQVVTRHSVNLFNRSHCPSSTMSPFRSSLAVHLPSFIEQLVNISEQYTSSCSNLHCDIIQSNYSGPVCLKNRQTYENLCEILFDLCTKQLDAEQLKIDYLGSCVSNCSAVPRCFSDDEICMMTPQPHCVQRQRNCTGFSPVCDTYGKTFVNRCHLSNSLIFGQPRQLAYHGPCRLNRQCTADVCESNETCVQTQNRYRFPVCLNCQANETLLQCPFELFCGDNRRQYINRCQLHNERCQTKTFIHIEHLGACVHDEDGDDEEQ